MIKFFLPTPTRPPKQFISYFTLKLKRINKFLTSRVDFIELKVFLCCSLYQIISIPNTYEDESDRRKILDALSSQTFLS